MDSINQNDCSVKLQKTIDTVLGSLSRASQGTRNNELNKSAFTLGGLVANRSLPHAEAERMLTDIALAIGLPESEAIGTITSGLAAGQLHPLEDEGAISPQAKKQNPIESERIHQAQQEKRAKQQTALAVIRKNRNDIIYHHNLNGKAEYVKKTWGLNDWTIDTFNVGYCNACPTNPASDSITIPYYWRNKLINIRHRLNHPNGSGKYRPEMAGLPSAIFNADLLDDGGDIIIVEGEFKAMILLQYGFPAIGLPGATNFKEKWVSLFQRATKVLIALDPDAEQAAIRIGNMLKKVGIYTKLVSLPVKPDDFFVLYGGSVRAFEYYLERGRVI